MDENFYIENTGRFAQIFNHENIEGVYELQVPLIYRALTLLGSVVKVQKHRILQQKANDSSFDIDDLERDVKATDPYIPREFNLNCLFLFHCSSENGVRQLFGLFSAPTESLYIFVVDPGKNQEAIPNIKKLYADKRSEWAPSMTQSTDFLEIRNMIDYPEGFDVKVSIHSQEKDALQALNRAFGDYKDQRKGSTIVVLQSAHTIRHLSMLGLSISQEFPFLSVPFHQRDNIFPAFGWQTNCTRRMIDHYFNLNDFLKDRLSLARYGDVPICNIDHDYTVFFADLFFSRRLKRAEMLSWYSPSEKPDLGGRELDDNKYELDELCLPEINISGNYPTICIELNIWDLALNTLIQSSIFDEFEGSFGGSVEMKSHLLDHHLKIAEHEDKFQKSTVRSFASANESRISAVTFGIIRNMIRSWSEDIPKHKRIASSLLEHLYRWIISSSSRLYDPAIFSLIHELMKRVFIHLIADLKSFGSQIIYASFDKIVLATSKTDVRNATSYMTYLLHSLRKKEMFTHIDLKPVMLWDHLIWMDMYNYGGILFENIEDIIGSENIDPEHGEIECHSTVDFRWNMAEYLPPACKKQFLKFAAEYVFEIDQYKRKQKQVASVSNVEKDVSKNISKAIVPSSKILENMSIFTRQLLSTVLKRRLLQVIRQIQRQELTQDDSNEEPYQFPLLPGSHLVLDNPALEFIKQITKFFSLDSTVSRESRLLRRDLLNLIGTREFSDEANFTNPCETFCLQQVICDFCNHCKDLDLTREENAEIQEDEELDLERSNCWSCPSCHTLYNKTEIEQKLVNIVRKRLLTWQVQDIKCQRCKLVRAEELLGNCAECTGKLVTEIDKTLFKRRMKVFQNIADFYEMDLLKEVVGWAVNLI
jgi:DNA polymerase epsilon subunit 1